MTLPCSIWHSRRYASVARSAVGSLCSRPNPLRVPVRRSSNRKRTTILTPNAVVVAAYDHPRHDTHQNLGKHQLTMGIIKRHLLSSPMVVVGSTMVVVVVVVAIV